MSRSHRLLSFNAPKSVVLGVASLLVLSGCAGADASSDESPSATAPASSVSATPSPTPTPTPAGEYKAASAEGPAQNVPLPEMPEAAKKETKEGLIAFLKYFFELVNYGYETGDVEPVKAISGPNCVACNSYYEDVATFYKNDDWMTGGSMSVMSTHTDFTPKDEQYQIVFQIQQASSEAYGPNGKHYGGNPANPVPAVQIMEASIQKGAWFVDNIETIQE